jgi:hypothetical protein
MKINSMFSLLIIFLLLNLFSADLFAQSEPVLYFCERYENQRGEVNVSDRFTTGSLTVMARSDNELNLEECFIKLEKWDPVSEEFQTYKTFRYSVEPDMNYIYFSKTDVNDMNFEEPGFYRVSLFDELESAVASALIEIIRR